MTEADHTHLPPDWQAFFEELGPGAATIGLFPVDGQDEAILFLCVPLNMDVPMQPLLSCTATVHDVEGILVLQVEIGLYTFGGKHSYPEDMPVFHILDEVERTAQRLTVQYYPLDQPEGLFETFLNPYNDEDRAILLYLAQTSTLAVSAVRLSHQGAKMLWGKRIGWKHQAPVQTALKRTADRSIPDGDHWQQAKEQVMQHVVWED